MHFILHLFIFYLYFRFFFFLESCLFETQQGKMKLCSGFILWTNQEIKWIPLLLSTNWVDWNRLDKLDLGIWNHPFSWKHGHSLYLLVEHRASVMFVPCWASTQLFEFVIEAVTILIHLEAISSSITADRCRFLHFFDYLLNERIMNYLFRFSTPENL